MNSTCLAVPLLLAAISPVQHGDTRPGTRPSPATASAPAVVAAKVGELTVRVPREWKSVELKSPMRKAEWVLPAGSTTASGAGAAKDASLVVTHFPGGAGDLESNLERWKKQFEQDPKDNAVVHESKGLVTLDIRGTYVAERMPGSGERLNEPGQRMLASIVETKAGPYYFKLVGPAATVERWKAAFEAMLSSRE